MTTGPETSIPLWIIIPALIFFGALSMVVKSLLFPGHPEWEQYKRDNKIRRHERMLERRSRNQRRRRRRA